MNLLEGDDLAEGDLAIKVNEAYAKRFEHNKQREELHRLQAKHPELAAKLAVKAWNLPTAADEEEGEGDTSTTEDEDDGDLPDDVEADILETLVRIKRHDPVIYQPDVHFFKEASPEPEDDSAGGADRQQQKSKPLYLKDMLAKQALEHGAELASDDEMEDANGGSSQQANTCTGKVYDEEQEQLRKAFLTAVEAVDGAEDGNDEFGGVLKKRAVHEVSSDDADANGDADGHQGPGPKRRKQQKGKPVGKLLDEYFGKDNELDPNERFLKNFILKKGWVDKNDDYIPSYHEVVGDDEADADGDIDDDEDEQHLEAVDRFEAAYNHRFEEPGGSDIVTHPRNIEGTIRKEDDKRKRKRAEKAAKQKLEEAQQAEEIKRLKNLKKKEIQDKLSQLQRVAGAAAPEISGMDAMLEGDFDPDTWDQKMAAVFNDDYYKAHEDAHDIFNDDLPDDLMAGDEDDDDEAAEFQKLRDRLAAGAKASTTDGQAAEDGGEEKDEAAEAEAATAADPEAVAAERAKMQEMLQEYYKLDYEGTAGGLRTRFRYREVPAAMFGLSVEDILFRSDKELNQVVGLRKLAPYREDTKARPNYKALQALKASGRPGAGQQVHKARKQNPKHWDKKHRQDNFPPHPQHQRNGSKHGNAAPKDGGKPQQQAGQSDVQQDQQQNKRKQQQQQQQRPAKKLKPDKEQQQQPQDAAQARLESYAKLTLKPAAGAGPNKAGPAARAQKQKPGASAAQQQAAAANAGSTPAGDGSASASLTKAQRKNLKRSLKRAAKHAATD